MNFYEKTRTTGRRKLPSVESVAKGKPDVPFEGANKYAEEAGRDTGTAGSVSGERPSDGRGLTTYTHHSMRTEVGNAGKSAKP